MVLAGVKLQEKDIKVKTQDPVVEFARDLKEGKCLFKRRIPKRGFNNIFAKKVIAINVDDLERFGEGSVVDINELINMGLIKRNFDKIKILGNGSISKNLTVKAHVFSKSAVEKIEAAGGKAEVI